MIRKIHGISFKINSIFIASMLLVISAVGIPFYYMYSKYMMKSVVDVLRYSVQTVEICIQQDELKQLRPESFRTQEYSVTWKKMKYLQETYQLRYLYVLRKDADGFRFIYDTQDDPDVKATEIEKGKYKFEFYPDVKEERKSLPFNQFDDDNYYTIYSDAPKEVTKSYSLKSMIEADPYTDKWGTFKSVYRPIMKNGEVVAVVGADYDLSYVLNMQRTAILLLISVVSAGLFVSLLMRFLIHKLIIRPILVLDQGSEELAHGNLDYKIDINRKDEIGSIGKSFNYMAENLKSTFQQIKDYSEKLEEKVAIRTSELSATLDKVQLLKNQQDGDYFLTTLLMNPLMQNRSRSKFMKIEFLMKQKKQFSFRNKNHHLGGDICISGDLTLSGKKYTLYFNGDAMGKSMQGAGGALVMGSMLNSILARSVTDRKMENTSPVQWLTDSFFEIQKVMEAFDGSMLVSGIFGLADNEKGKIHYINAEHPFSILYRDGTALFIEENISAHKFGMMDNTPEILSFQMRNNDTIFCGSDGKDDVKYFDEDDPEKINEDEFRIFETIMEASGQLSEILRVLEKKGNLTDDISILKLTFTAEDEEAWRRKIISDIVKKSAELVKERKYQEAYDLVCTENYQNLSLVYCKASILVKMGRLKDAATSILVSDEEIQSHNKVLILMGKIYYELGEYSISRKYLEILLKRDPENTSVKNGLKRLDNLEKNSSGF